MNPSRIHLAHKMRGRVQTTKNTPRIPRAILTTTPNRTAMPPTRSSCRRCVAHNGP
ncbi:hypothetical protein IEO21_09084 [Rhodonia placenta]|uniref:Uncharacterized protein n=1 Tax=Rhodonia placenta TaxID=104341 RepID=A0A8H7TYT0_9APHY|nr:hypothetical protein IEO21_09084 [Postia placenta]